MSESVAAPARKYAVFISYRHADNKEQGRQWASWLHHTLETYEVPPDLVGRTNLRGEHVPASLYPVFRDEEELPADADLSANIERALSHSALLVVLCSPRAVESRFVADEIRFFKELGKAGHILALMIDGEPNAADDPGKARDGISPDQECLPHPLRYGVTREDGSIDWTRRTEPIAADVRPDNKPSEGWTSAAAYGQELTRRGLRKPAIERLTAKYEEQLQLATLKIIAGAIGLPLGDITQRNRAHQLQRARERAVRLRYLALAFAILGLVAMGGGIIAWVQRNEAESQRIDAERQKKVALQQKAIADEQRVAAQTSAQKEAEQRKIAEAQRTEAQTQRKTAQEESARRKQQLKDAARADRAAAMNLINLGQSQAAMAHLARACDFDPESTLAAEMFVLEANNGLPPPLVTSAAGVSQMHVSPDGKLVAIFGIGRPVRLLESVTGKLTELATESDGIDWSRISSLGVFSPDGQRLLVGSNEIWDVGTMSRTAQIKTSLEQPHFNLDGSKIVTIAGNWDVAILDGITGAELHRHRMAFSEEPAFADLSPDGKTIAVAMKHASSLAERSGAQSSNRDIWLLDAATGTKFAILASPGGGRRVREASCAFSPDGRRLLSSNGGAVRLWDIDRARAAGSSLLKPRAPGSSYLVPKLGPIVSADDGLGAFSGDSSHVLVVGTRENGLWSTATGKGTLRFRDQDIGETESLSCARFSPDGMRCAIASGSKASFLYLTPSGASKPLNLPSQVEGLEFSPDGQQIITWSGDRMVRLWDSEQGALRLVLPHPDQIEKAAFVADGRSVVTLCKDRQLRVWRLEVTSLSTRFPLAMIGSVRCTLERYLTPAPNPLMARPAQLDSLTGKVVATRLLSAEDQIAGYSFGTTRPSHDGLRAMTTLVKIRDNSIIQEKLQFWDTVTGTVFSETKAVENGAHYFSGWQYWDVSGELFIEPVFDGPRVIDIRSGKVVSVLSRPISQTWARFSPNGQFILAPLGPVEKAAGIWDVRTGKQRALLSGHSTIVADTAISPRSDKVLTVAVGDPARIWSADSGQLLHTLGDNSDGSHRTGYHFGQFSPDGTRVVTSDNGVSLWDADSGKFLFSLKRGEGKLLNALFTPNGRKIMTASSDNTVEIWNAADGALLASIRDCALPRDAAVSKDGCRLITTTGGNASSIKVCELPSFGHAPLPDWYADLVRVSSRRSFNALGQVADIPQEELIVLRDRVAKKAAVDQTRYGELARWLLLSAELRPLRPGTAMSAKRLADELIRVDASPAEIEQAYELDAWHPLIRIARAKRFAHWHGDAWFRRFAMERLGDNPDLWARALELLRQQNAPEETEALAKLEKLDPKRALELKQRVK